jgi:hypothetical protein
MTFSVSGALFVAAGLPELCLVDGWWLGFFALVFLLDIINEGLFNNYVGQNV